MIASADFSFSLSLYVTPGVVVEKILVLPPLRQNHTFSFFFLRPNLPFSIFLTHITPGRLSPSPTLYTPFINLFFIDDFFRSFFFPDPLGEDYFH